MTIRPIGVPGVFLGGLGVLAAADILWAMTSPEMYRRLVVERGWSPDRYEEWLAEACASLILNPA